MNGHKFGWDRLVAQLVPGGLLFLAWQFVVWVNPHLVFFIGSPLLYLRAFGGAVTASTQVGSHHFQTGALIIDTLITAFETLCGFFVGNLLGAIAGLWLSRNATVRFIFSPYIVLLGAAPLFAFAPIIVLWFGIGIFSKVMVSAFSTIFVALMQSFKGATEVNPSLVAVARSFGASDAQVFRKIVIPSASVWVINGFRLNVGFALLGAFLGEFISSSNGLGHMILIAGGLYNIPSVLVGVTAISLLGLALTLAVDAVEPLARKFLSRAF